MTGDARRVPALDGLRGVAVLLVVAVHGGWLPGGHLGVTVFFVLSGYLITNLLVGEHERRGRVDLRRFYARRVVRLTPALLVAVTALSLGLTLVESPATVLIRWLASVLQIGNLRILWSGPDSMAFYGWTWSLATEEQFYLVWPPLLLWLIATGRRRGAAVGAVTVAAGSLAAMTCATVAGHEVTAYYAPWFRVSGLAAGCAVALITRGRAVRPSGPIGGTWLILLCAAAWQMPWPNPLGEPLAVVASCVLLLHGPAVGPLAWRWLVHVGRVSYGLYLWHLVLYCLQLAGVITFPSPVVWLICSLALTEVSWWGLERPLLRRHSPAPRVLATAPARGS